MAKSKKRKGKARPPKPAAKATVKTPASAASGGYAGAAKPAKARSKPAASAQGGGSAAQRLILALCAAGIALTTYLTYVAVAGDHPAYCSDGSSCDLVQSSRWSTLLGLPMATWGLATYVLLGYLCWTRARKPSRWKAAFFVAVGGVAISTYLTVVSVVEIEATCAYCLASYGIISAITLLLAMTKPSAPAAGDWSRVLPAPLIAAAVLVAGMQFHFSGLFDPGAGPENPLQRSLALHLNEIGAKFYGAYWCPRCQDQKALFGASVKRLPYVECSPQGRNGGQSAACTVNNIQDYPTWIIKERRHVGLQSLSALETYSGFKPPKP